jgi:hypothetical protein
VLLAASLPRTTTEPLSGEISPPRIRSSVVLPAPFGPSSAWISPAGGLRIAMPPGQNN